MCVCVCVCVCLCVFVCVCEKENEGISKVTLCSFLLVNECLFRLIHEFVVCACVCVYVCVCLFSPAEAALSDSLRPGFAPLY